MARDSPWTGVGKYKGQETGTNGGLITLIPVTLENMDS